MIRPFIVGAILSGTMTLSALSATAHAQTRDHWYLCRIHLDWATMRHVTRRNCWAIPMKETRPVTGWTVRRDRVSPHVIRSVRFPVFRQVDRAVSPPYVPFSSGETRTWLVTWYGPTGNAMANGQMPFVGAAACGDEVAMGTRVTVHWPNGNVLGTFTCLDRIGYQPFQHIDIYGIPIGSFTGNVTVYS